LWGSPEELKDDAIISLKRMLPTFDEKWIDSVEDQSDDKKGIKFEFKVGKDLVHMFKVGGNRGYWEYYLNKKKTGERKLQDHFDKTLMSPIDAFMKYASSYDFYSDYIDDGGQYQRAVANNKVVKDMFDKLSKSDQKEAIKILNKQFDKDLVKRHFR
jgi:hypothetical protein